MRPASALVLLLSIYPFAVNAASYTLAKEYSGQTFFNDWSYYGSWDNLTQGDVNWVSEQNATLEQLTYVNAAGNAILKIDNTSIVLPQDKRDAPRITSLDWFPVGSVFVLDAVHTPWGCSVWPGFWTTGANWPAGGEIDIFEGVNRDTQSQMSLHTCSGCTQPVTANQTGTTNSTSCNSDDGGCTVLGPNSTSYGPGFAAVGGGAWAAQFDVSGINVWFWSRKDIPPSLSNANNTVDTSSWGIPSASFTSCNISQYFGSQQIVIDITLCGQEAGLAAIWGPQCGAGISNITDLQTCYVTDVINNGTSDYANAYFEINYVKVFTTNGQTTSQPVNPPLSCAIASAPSSSGGPTSAPPPTESEFPNDSSKIAPATYLVTVAGMLLAGMLLQGF